MPYDPYLAEIKFRGPGNQDFIDIAVPEGTDPSTIRVVVYNANTWTIRSDTTLSGSPESNIGNTDVYLLQVPVHKNGAIALVVDGVVTQFVSFESTLTPTVGPAAGQTSNALGANGFGESFVSTDGGDTYTVETDLTPGVVPCFLAGTKIKTLYGLCRIEDLTAGDPVAVRNGGYQPVRWLGQRQVTASEARAFELYPVEIPQGVLGNRKPVFVSPAHRLMVKTPVVQEMVSTRSAFVSANQLVGWRGIRRATEIETPIYVHVFFDKHEIVNTHGLHSESFHPGKRALAGLDRMTKRELLRLFPGLQDVDHGYGPVARPCLKRHQVKQVLKELDRAA